MSMTIDEASTKQHTALSGNKKRQLPSEDEDLNHDNSAEAATNATTSVDAFKLSLVTGVRLEAVFYPKFDNEDSTQSVRSQMLSQLRQSDHCWLEVSLKHSGSLILWSGGVRFYSKNAAGNRFTMVAEILLRQHYVRMHGSVTAGQAAYDHCSSQLQNHRQTVAFEVVTNVLGDHGQRPCRDFLVCTALVNRATETFASTLDLATFCQHFGLPHNDVWIVRGAEAAQRLLTYYDEHRETATCDDVVTTLQALPDTTHLASVYPHADFQGSILEGLVLRLVHDDGSQNDAPTLARTSQLILQRVPPSVPDGHAVTQRTAEQSQPPTPMWALADVRDTFHHLARGDNEAFETLLRSILPREDGTSSRPTVMPTPPTSEVVRPQPASSASARVHGSKAINLLDFILHFQNLQTPDSETRRITQVLQTLLHMERAVRVTWLHDDNDGGSRWLGMLHVLHDTTFAKYHKIQGEHDMSLFRGFCFEVVCDAAAPDVVAGNDGVADISLLRIASNNGLSTDKNADASISSLMLEQPLPRRSLTPPLMLKMKFVPYMVRTFIARNGLHILHKNGPTAFLPFADTQLRKWGVSVPTRDHWIRFFTGWATFASHKPHEAGQPEMKMDNVLSDSNYLGYFEAYLQLFEVGKADHYISSDPHQHGTFCGLVIVLSATLEDAMSLATQLAAELGIARHLESLDAITDFLLYQCRNTGNGAIVAGRVSDRRPGSLNKKELHKHGHVTSIVLYRCADTDFDRMLIEEKNKGRGMREMWRNAAVANVVGVDAPPDHVGIAPSDQNDVSFQHAIQRIKTVSNNLDAKQRGNGTALVFFPQIPGCGKSALTNFLTAPDAAWDGSKLVGQVKVLHGDQVRDKYWNQVKAYVADHRPHGMICDKNTPRLAWDNVAQICAVTNSTAVAVIPDETCRQTTFVHGYRSVQDSNVVTTTNEHVYPFSLAYLALCMARVLERPVGTHEGRLDQGASRACLIVIKLFSLYRKVLAADFVTHLQGVFAKEGARFASPIVVPVLEEDASISPDLQDLLIEGLQVQYGYDLQKIDPTRLPNAGAADENKPAAAGPKSKQADQEYLDRLEQRLRAALARHKATILQQAARWTTSSEAFRTQCAEKLAAIQSPPCGDPAYTQRRIKIVSIDISVADVHKLICAHIPQAVLDQLPFPAEGLDSTKQVDGTLVAQTHVTLAHYTRLPQSELQLIYGALVGSGVNVVVTAVWWSAYAVALEVQVDNNVPVRNSFAHITVWFATGHSASEALRLPECGAAHHTTISAPAARLSGKVQFWWH